MKDIVDLLYMSAAKDETQPSYSIEENMRCPEDDEIDRLASIVYNTGALEDALAERDNQMKEAISLSTKNINYFGPTKEAIEFASMIMNEVRRNVIDINDVRKQKILNR